MSDHTKRDLQSLKLLVSGVRYRSASIDIREKFVLQERELIAALEVLKACPGVEECIILTTCNRTELYTVVRETSLGIQAVQQFYQQLKDFDIRPYRSSIFHLLHEDAVAHLFRVASGLDSLVMGEGQIMGQVKEALALAQQEKSSGLLLNKLFKSALSVGKRIRTKTGLADKDVSVSLAAYHFIQTIDLNCMDRPIAIMGGGKMAELLMSLFRQNMTPQQQTQVVIVNRNTERLNELSARYGFSGMGWERLDEAISMSDILFVATGAPHVVLGRLDFEDKGPKKVMDIAVPRNVDPRVATHCPHVELFNTDHLKDIQGFSLDAQFKIREEAQLMVEEACLDFHQWWLSLSVLPTLTGLRAKVEQMRQAELAVLPSSEQYTVMDTLSKKLVRKILHAPTVGLKNSKDSATILQQASILRQLFDIDAVSMLVEND